MLIINRPLVGRDNDEHYAALIKRQTKDDRNQGTPRNYVSISLGSTVAVQWEDGGPWTHGTIEEKATRVIMTDPTKYTSQKQVD